MKKETDHIVYTNKALCRDCNKCVRVCPVNAIKINNAQAQVISEKCIDCGACVLECPQGAKTYTSYINQVEKLIREDPVVIATIAPSFASVYEKWQVKRFPSVLRMAGFDKITETASGAYYSAVKTKEYIDENPNRSHLCTACPAVVSYVEKYCPSLIDNLVPVVSPVIAHAKMLKHKYPGCKIVFIGPCIAKIKEVQRSEFKGLVDAAITFEHLADFLVNRKIKFDNCEESYFDEIPPGESRLFPLEGGLMRTAGMSTDILDNNYLSISGPKNVQQALSLIHNESGNIVVEPLYCKHGCINGPAIPKDINAFKGKQDIINYSKKNKVNNYESVHKTPELSTKFCKNASLNQIKYTEEQIYDVLKKTGKNTKENELNCGGCGYDTCRLKAMAVLEGIAEVEMCIPYMRRLAEKRSHLIIEKDPNGIVILDDKLRIRQMNPAFKKMFFCSDSTLDQHISYLVDALPFEKLLVNPDDVIREEVKLPNYNIICHQFCYSIPEENKYIGIFIDITEFRNNSTRLTEIKTDTIIKAHELIDHQIKMAQEQVKFLGESTAKGEVLLQRLIDAIER